MEKFKKVEFVNLGEKTTVCCLVEDDGYEITGVFTCKPDMLDKQEYRNERAYENALKKLDRGKQIRISKQQ